MFLSFKIYHLLFSDVHNESQDAQVTRQYVIIHGQTICKNKKSASQPAAISSGSLII